MHLDRDDRGASNDSVEVNGRTITNPLNQEVVTLRGIVTGEYIVNAHYYDQSKSASVGPARPDARLGQPVPVTLSLVKVNPRAEIAFHGQHTLRGPGDETTLVRFTVRSDGTITRLEHAGEDARDGAALTVATTTSTSATTNETRPEEPPCRSP